MYIYIYIERERDTYSYCVYVCVYIHNIYIYIYTHMNCQAAAGALHADHHHERVGEDEAGHHPLEGLALDLGCGQMGSALMGSLQK